MEISATSYFRHKDSVIAGLEGLGESAFLRNVLNSEAISNMKIENISESLFDELYRLFAAFDRADANGWSLS